MLVKILKMGVLLVLSCTGLSANIFAQSETLLWADFNRTNDNFLPIREKINRGEIDATYLNMLGGNQFSSSLEMLATSDKPVLITTTSYELSKILSEIADSDRNFQLPTTIYSSTGPFSYTEALVGREDFDAAKELLENVSSKGVKIVMTPTQEDRAIIVSNMIAPKADQLNFPMQDIRLIANTNWTIPLMMQQLGVDAGVNATTLPWTTEAGVAGLQDKVLTVRSSPDLNLNRLFAILEIPVGDGNLNETFISKPTKLPLEQNNLLSDIAITMTQIAAAGKCCVRPTQSNCIPWEKSMLLNLKQQTLLDHDSIDR